MFPRRTLRVSRKRTVTLGASHNNACRTIMYRSLNPLFCGIFATVVVCIKSLMLWYTAVSTKYLPQQQHAVMPIGIMGSNSLALLGWGSRCLAEGKKRHEHTSLCCFLLSRWNTLLFDQSTVKPPLPIITFDIVAFVFTLLSDNLSRNSCMKPRCRRIGVLFDSISAIQTSKS